MLYVSNSLRFPFGVITQIIILLVLMATGYEKTIRENLNRIYSKETETLTLAKNLPASREGLIFKFRALGEETTLSPEGISLSGKPDLGPRGLLISLYALHATSEPSKLEPFKAFKDFPDSMPYQNAFSANSERVLVPHVPRIHASMSRILPSFQGEKNPGSLPGDFSLLLFPFPKIALCYVFYLQDEDFPASAICLFSSNALFFMPLDGLADVAEYSSRKIVELL